MSLILKAKCLTQIQHKGNKMSLKTSLEFARNASEEKVPFRFQFPVHTKKEFESLCEKHEVSMTDMILGLIQSAIDEDKGVHEVATLSIIEKLEKLRNSYRELEKAHINSGDDILETSDGSIYYLKEDMEANLLSQKALNNELKRRTK